VNITFALSKMPAYPQTSTSRSTRPSQRSIGQHTITPVTKSTPLINSIQRTLQIYLDSKNLNHTVQWEHYQLSTIDDIATCLHRTKVSTSLDDFGMFRTIINTYDISHTIWLVSLDENAFWDLISPRSVSTLHAPVN